MAEPLVESSPAEPQAGPDRGWARFDLVAYAVWSAACVLYAAVGFYRSMHAQTGGTWSAPLDDVFIHFDYARAAARGYPFQWSEGNGYSSGNTSLTYPFVLALGYIVGFRGLLLMKWAALVACISTLGFLVAAAGLFETPERAAWGRWGKYLLPPAVLSLGALDWTLFSGMENAFHLGVWGLALLPVLSILRRAAGGGSGADVTRDAWLGGLACALLFATRPESVVCIAILAVAAGTAAVRVVGRREALGVALRVSAPSAIVLVAQAVSNRILTGEWAAAGAIVKLSVNNPYMAAGDKLGEYFYFLKYVVLRNTQHHFADALPWGWLVPFVALLPLASPRTRAVATILWAHVVGWLALVSMNGQVRWQNERYTMPAVAWLFVLAAMGVAGLLAPVAAATRRARLVWAGRAAVGAAAMALYAIHQAPNFRDQVWFFGRASRNIRDQHVVAGLLLRDIDPPPGRIRSRVLVGDAGALIYASDRPGLDLIGLGGYRDLPFARAGVHGLGASLELIERMDADERPDVMALYPSWWGDLPSIFGRRITEVPVSGNVICGGAEKVLYRADWSAMDRRGGPRSLVEGELVLDELDVADLVSERQHAYEFPHPGAGFVAFRVLPDPARRARDLFDAGRVVPAGGVESATMRLPRGGGRLLVRTVVDADAKVEVAIDGVVLGRFALSRKSGWSETSIELPPSTADRGRLTLRSIEGAWTNHHVWTSQKRPAELSQRHDE